MARCSTIAAIRRCRMPCGQDRDGLPIGLQLVGKRWSESRLLGIAKAIEPLTGGFRRPPGY